ncbi:tetratricopeptide repeat protein [Aeoliella sp.]|uniref:tetratricopeptide repeat protein n=1 Tax=Aeoliella sp. TaxID=2795800 RepID=UPI003CCB8DAD
MQPTRRRSENSPARVLLVGWDAADWQMIHPLVQQGLMPTTAALLQRGAWGNLATTRPILSPMLWNTIATGKRPLYHGIHGFTEPNADGTGVQPSSSTSRKCKAIWNILTQSGLKSNIVGWYASHPAEPINGVMVSNQFEQYKVEEGVASPLPAGCVHPVEMADELASLRVLPSEIDHTAVLPFIPQAAELIEKEGQRVGKLCHMLAQTATIHAVATHLMTKSEWDFTAVFYEGIDRFGHEFMEFHPPKMDEVSQEDFDVYQHCMVGIYRFHDMLLDTLLTLAGDDTAVILMSDHGYYNDHLRPDPREGKSGPVEWHRPFGILAGCGPGFHAGNRLYGATIQDIAPTVLHLLGLPAAYDMPGRVLSEVLEETETIQRIESWEEIDGECGMHPPDARVDPAESQAVLRQLIALGYINPPGDDADKAIRQTMASNQISLAESLVDSFKYAEAIEVIEQLEEEQKNSSAMQLMLTSCYIGTQNKEQAREILQSLSEKLPEHPRVNMILGVLELAEGNPENALSYFQRAMEVEPRLPHVHNKLGEVYISMKRYDEAIAAFEKALEIDSESPVAFAGLARAQLEAGNPEQALEQALIAAELVHFFPRVHFVIGKALLALGDPTGAVEALELCVKQAPKMSAAHKSLASAYRGMGLADKAMAADLRSKGTIV